MADLTSATRHPLGPRPVFLVVATGQLLATIPFALVAFGGGRKEPAPTVS